MKDDECLVDAALELLTKQQAENLPIRWGEAAEKVVHRLLVRDANAWIISVGIPNAGTSTARADLSLPALT
jgi:hypothetical protein